MGLAVYTSYDYARTRFKELPAVYNTLYVTSDHPSKGAKQLKEKNLFYTTAEEDKQTFRSLLDNMGILIVLLVICSVILGATVIFCLNLMNLTIREFEYMFMNIMGYSKRRILQTINKENLLQLLISIPLGFLAGNWLLEAIKEQFSQNSFAMQPSIRLESYIFTALVVSIISSFRLLISNRYIEGLAIVEGLKVQEE
ncbi:MAG: FtsX-like permease family protein [Enterococcus sp.]|nr:ABC transporter permease [Enterococcus sp.]MDN6002502.1 FtsX-like permease family protein [Enterococcus sp.]MDN6217543.1 FtsX-like permease family protein [Enterococcus sp.]MDN6517350.1 FtsX-like permease family protein [Enterococcus sp.]MDN6562421.1 FtsX-like permease family protein [Enterococcus sp.]MDN6616590.1 FtsX-like permease family protein [Enterococcus sp.]